MKRDLLWFTILIGGGFAIYKFVLKPKIAKKEIQKITQDNKLIEMDINPLYEKEK
jgi:hypothetical protein